MRLRFFLFFIIFSSIVVADENCKLSQTPFGNLIKQHESFGGNYNVYNKPQTYQIIKTENISELSIAEIINRQLVQKNIHAAGAYQMARSQDKNKVWHSIIEGCAKSLGVSFSEKFSKTFQDRCFDEYLTTSKKGRGAIYNYFYGDGSITSAALAVAQEWASMPVAIGTRKSNKSIATTEKESYYTNGKDKAGTTYSNLISIMAATKLQIQSNQCNPEEQVDNNQTDNNQTGSGRQETPAITPEEYNIKNNTYFDGTCNDIDFRPESNSCGYSPIVSKQIGGNPYEYNTQNVDDCYCAADQNPSSGQYGVVNADIVPTEVKLNEETTQMIIDSINTLVYLREYWTRGLGIEAYGLAPQVSFQPSNNMEQRKLNDTLEKKNKEKCVTLEAKINELSAQISKIEQELYQISK